MLYALDNMTSDVRSKLSTFVHVGSGASQKSLTSGTDHRVQDTTTIDRSLPECADYTHYYAHYGAQLAGPPANLELKHVIYQNSRYL